MERATAATAAVPARIMSVTTLSGSAVGFVAFVVLGLAPALYFGGFAGLVLAGGIFGAPVVPTLLSQGLVVFGMVLGVLAVGSLFLVGGAFLGSVIGWITLAVTGNLSQLEDEEA